jgi:prepilin-type N-terminal cleavage/methylation domain-containing protein
MDGAGVTHKTGFTLIELSIVLVIIGLLVGGILVGRDLIKAAEIRAQISQIEKYNTAVHTFQTKYNGIPGDLLYTQAQAFGLYTITYAPYIGYAGYGDGNGLINTGSGASMAISPYTFVYAEPVMFWRHLSEANLIDGTYGTNLSNRGETPVTSSPDVINSFLPLAKIGNGASIEANYPGNGQNYFALIKVLDFWGAGGHGSSSNPLTAQQAYAIDTKMDDGLPATGNVIAINGAGWRVLDTYSTWTTPSAVSGCVASSAYALTQTTQSCSLRFKFQ